MGNNTFFAGSIPKNYDRFLGPLLFEPYALDIVSRIKNRNVSSVLELACGTGRVTVHLRNALPETTLVTATDLNPDMLNVAKERMPQAAVTWLAADMQDLPFDNESFDLVICQFGVMFVPDKPKAFHEAFRVLRKNGTFLFNTWDRIEHNGVTHQIDQALKIFFKENPLKFYEVPFSLYDPDHLKALASAAGFSGTNVQLVQKRGRCSSPDDAATGLIEGTPLSKEISDRDPAFVKTIVELVRKQVASRYGEGPFEDNLQAWVAESKK